MFAMKTKIKKMKARSPQFGEGIFTLPDVAKILHLPKQNVWRWANEFWDKKFSAQHGGVVYLMGTGRDKTVDFYTMIEFYVFSRLREYGVSAQKIQKAHKALSEKLNTPYPFATYQLLTDGRTIFFDDNNDGIVDADLSLQFNIKDAISPFCKKVDFGEDNLPARFWPQGKSSAVVVDPKRRFGQPIIEGTNILVDIIYSYYKAGETVEFIARLYDIATSKVYDAINFCEKNKAA
jgi:uncharacterized protein (DUF433 family)